MRARSWDRADVDQVHVGPTGRGGGDGKDTSGPFLLITRGLAPKLISDRCKRGDDYQLALLRNTSVLHSALRGGRNCTVPSEYSKGKRKRERERERERERKRSTSNALGFN